MRWLLICVLMTTVVHAAELTPEQKAQAADASLEAKRHFRLGHFIEAAGEYERVYKITGNFELLYNLAQSYRKAQNNEKALQFYKSYLEEGGQAVRPNVRRMVQQRIVELVALVQQQRNAQSAPPDGLDRPTESPASATPAKEVVVTPEPPTVVASRSRRPAWRHPAVLTLGIAGVALLAGGGALLALAADRGGVAKTAPTLDGRLSAHADDLTYQQVGFPLVGIGAASLVSAVIVFGVEARK